MEVTLEKETKRNLEDLCFNNENLDISDSENKSSENKNSNKNRKLNKIHQKDINPSFVLSDVKTSKEAESIEVLKSEDSDLSEKNASSLSQLQDAEIIESGENVSIVVTNTRIIEGLEDLLNFEGIPAPTIIEALLDVLEPKTREAPQAVLYPVETSYQTMNKIPNDSPEKYPAAAENLQTQKLEEASSALKFQRDTKNKYLTEAAEKAFPSFKFAEKNDDNLYTQTLNEIYNYNSSLKSLNLLSAICRAVLQDLRCVCAQELEIASESITSRHIVPQDHITHLCEVFFLDVMVSEDFLNSAKEFLSNEEINMLLSLKPTFTEYIKESGDALGTLKKDSEFKKKINLDEIFNKIEHQLQLFPYDEEFI